MVWVEDENNDIFNQELCYMRPPCKFTTQIKLK